MTVTLREPAWRALGERFADILAAWGGEVEAEAQRQAPVLTGFLASRMFVMVYLDGALVYGEPRPVEGLSGKGFELFIGNDAGYGRWVHDGTSDTPPHPFLATAAVMLRDRLLAALRS